MRRRPMLCVERGGARTGTSNLVSVCVLGGGCRGGGVSLEGYQSFQMRRKKLCCKKQDITHFFHACV